MVKEKRLLVGARCVVALSLVIPAWCANVLCAHDVRNERTEIPLGETAKKLNHVERLLKSASSKGNASSSNDASGNFAADCRTFCDELLSLREVRERDALFDSVERTILDSVAPRYDGDEEVRYFSNVCLMLDILCGAIWEATNDDKRVIDLWIRQRERFSAEERRSMAEMKALEREAKRLEAIMLANNMRSFIVSTNYISEAEIESRNDVMQRMIRMKERMNVLAMVKQSYGAWDVGSIGRRIADGAAYRRYRNGGQVLEEVRGIVDWMPFCGLLDKACCPYNSYTNYCGEVSKRCQFTGLRVLAVPDEEARSKLCDAIEKIVFASMSVHRRGIEEKNYFAASCIMLDAFSRALWEATGDPKRVIGLWRRQHCKYSEIADLRREEISALRKESKQLLDEVQRQRSKENTSGVPFYKLPQSEKNKINEQSIRLRDISIRLYDLVEITRFYDSWSVGEQGRTLDGGKIYQMYLDEKPEQDPKGDLSSRVNHGIP